MTVVTLVCVCVAVKPLVCLPIVNDDEEPVCKCSV